MLKNTVTGSMLAKLLPGVAKFFLENASQDEVTKAEQEAAVLHQKLEAAEVVAEATPTPAVAAEPAEATTDAGAMPLEVPAPQPNAVDVVALTKRATDAEAKADTLAIDLATAQADRDKYKGWYDKQADAGTKLPGGDASTNNQAAADKPLTAADQYALSLITGQ